MNNSIEIIGIDHGWSQMKTSNYCFNTSIKELPNVPAFTDNVLQYDNRHFAVGDERLEVLDSKVEKPTMEFNGVRISWVICCIKELLTWLIFSTALRAASNLRFMERVRTYR